MTTPADTFLTIYHAYVGKLSLREEEYIRGFVTHPGWYKVVNTSMSDIEINYVGDLKPKELKRLRIMESADLAGVRPMKNIITPDPDTNYILAS